MTTERDYVLGTGDEELARLELQHRVWRPRVLDVWKRAGFREGQTILDLGCGPGFATEDLAAIVGATGRVTGVDRSRRFLDALEHRAADRGLSQIATIEADLDELALMPASADAIWCRWAAAFVRRPHDLIRQIHRALKPGGVFVSHEYFNYGAWQMAPPCEALDTFVSLVIDSWRQAGGEPDIGREIPAWLEELGFDVTVAPIIHVVGPADPLWQWPRAFVHSGVHRFVDLGVLTRDAGDDLHARIIACMDGAHSRVITPGLLEVVGVKR